MKRNYDLSSLLEKDITSEDPAIPTRKMQRKQAIDPLKSTTFLSKTHRMIDSCDPAIASWTDDGEMIEVKDPDRFAEKIIPEFFNHNNFSSFARQLNFYGFCKIPSRELRHNNRGGDSNNENNTHSSNYVTFHNENFKRDRPDLMSRIQRSTKPQNPGMSSDQQEEIDDLKNQLVKMREEMANMEDMLEGRIVDMKNHFQHRIDDIKANAGLIRVDNVIIKSSSPPEPSTSHTTFFAQPWESRQMDLHIEEAERQMQKSNGESV